METFEKKLVLTIDDDHDTRALFKMVLEEENFTVIEAENGTRGIDIFEKKNPDLVLLDLRMPGISGFEVLVHITKISPATPVIVISATDSIDDVVESLRLGAWDFILKPMQTYNIMLHRVNQVLEKSQLKNQNIEYQALLEDAINKLQTDLKSGQDIQMKLLPESPASFKEYQFNSLILPSLYLSGDFVDYFAIDEKYTAFYIADVSGHGVSSALVTVFLKSFMNKSIDDFKHNKIRTILDPGKLLQALNQDFLSEHLDKFSTMFYGVIDHGKNNLTYCNGGHYPYPILRQNGNCAVLESKNTPVGIMPDIAFENISVQFEDNFFLAFFSDGILDILPQETLDKKIELLNELCASEKEAFQDFISGLKDNSSGLPDDITVLTIEKAFPNER